MAKNSTKKAKFKPIEFEIKKSIFKKVLENQLKTISQEPNTILNGVQFKTDGNILTLASTDGNTLLKSEIELENLLPKFEIVLNGLYLLKTKIFNSYENGRKSTFSLFDTLVITLYEDHATIEDKLNKIKYNIPAFSSDISFPKYDQLIPDITKEPYTKIGFNTKFLERFSNISNCRTREGILSVNKNNPLACFLITAENKEDFVKSTALIMPREIRG